MSRSNSRGVEIEVFFDNVQSKQIFHRHGNLGTSGKLARYVDYVFDGHNLPDANVLDVGAGRGVFSVYMALRGASRVVSLEPELEGGSETMVRQFHDLVSTFALKNISIERETFQSFHVVEQFDFILLHNSINHLDEEACMNLRSSNSAKATYDRLFRKLYDLTAPGGRVTIVDCSNRNLLGDLRMPNPLRPNIEWNKHCPCHVWREFAERAGFVYVAHRYETPGLFGSIGRATMANRFVSYIGLSAFSLVVQRP